MALQCHQLFEESKLPTTTFAEADPKYAFSPLALQQHAVTPFCTVESNITICGDQLFEPRTSSFQTKAVRSCDEVRSNDVTGDQSTPVTG
mmetsp:Transcript_53946/g.62007  ORF Transcript_53946/g.62007 Transcript_53946/m.62007 type:complete len:90 (+) Transcript_53946:622-891(+)